MRERQRTEFLTAFVVTEPQPYELPSGRLVTPLVGDWVLSRGSHVLSILPDREFHLQYEIVDDQALTLSGADRIVIERTLGFAATETRDHLLTAITRLARLEIGSIVVDFSPAQWEELAHRATKRGLPVATLVKQIVDKLTQDLWTVA